MVTGTFHITLTATNGLAPNAIQNFTLKVLGLHVVTTTLPSGQLAKAYSASLSAIGATPPYRWIVVEPDGTLPNGLHLRKGVISGTPTQVGTFKFTVQVSDEKKYGGQVASAVMTLKIT
jgi:hypothetical protein